ncbi:MAG: (Fe-S)-binding protein [Candidatus Melainabacteria bacterium]|nr:(Fe-S)-binding protein [Candidatus Melainabacteria bacterium]
MANRFEPAHNPTPVEIDSNLLDACTHCGFCLPACPTYQVTGSEAESPRGRIYLMRKWLEGEVQSAEAVAPHLDQCLGCLNCQTVCPSGVQYGSLLFGSRAALARQRRSNGWARAFKRFAFQALLPSPKLLRLIGRCVWLYEASGLQSLVRKSRILNLLPTLKNWESLTPVMTQQRYSRPLSPGMSFGNPNNERVVLFLGCIMDVVYRDVHWATIIALVANGYYVMLPPQTCCGALAHHAGEEDIARSLAKANLDKILRTNPDWVVLNSAGCGASLKEYPHLFHGDSVYAAKAESFSSKVVDVMQLLARKPLAPMKALPERTVTYHAACHLHHAQGVQLEPFQVLQQVPNLTLIPLTDHDACCGSAGIYNLEQPELSHEILQRKMTEVAKTQAEFVVTGNPGCLLQLQSGIQQAELSMTVRHPVELLADGYAHIPL